MYSFVRNCEFGMYSFVRKSEFDTNSPVEPKSEVLVPSNDMPSGLSISLVVCDPISVSVSTSDPSSRRLLTAGRPIDVAAHASWRTRPYQEAYSRPQKRQRHGLVDGWTCRK
eukprot:272385_1